MMKQLGIVLIFIILHSFVTQSFAESGNQSSNHLQKKIIDSLNVQVRELAQSDVAKAKIFCQKSIVLSKKINYDKGLAKAYMHMGILRRYENKHTEANYYHEKALKIYKRINSQRGVAKCLLNQGTIFVDLDKLQESLTYFNKSLKIAEQIRDDSIKETLLLNIGVVHEKTGDYTKALDYYLKSMALNEVTNNSKGLASSLSSVARVYQNISDLEKAIFYHKKGYRIYQEINHLRGMALTCLNLGSTYWEKGDSKEAYRYFKEAHDLYFKLGDEILRHLCLMHIGDIYLDKKEYSKALDNFNRSAAVFINHKDWLSLSKCYTHTAKTYQAMKQYSPALGYAKKALNMAEKMESMTYIHRCYVNLYSIEKDAGDLKNALEHLELAFDYADSLYSNNSQLKLKELKEKYEIETRERKIAGLKKERDMQKQIALQEHQNSQILIGGIISLFFVISVIIYLYYKIRESKQSLYLQNRQLEELNSKLTLSEKALNQSNTTKDRFFSIIAHDLKSPLNTLHAIIHVFKANISLEAKDFTQYMDSLEKELTNVKSLLDQLLYWALLQQNEINYIPEKVNVNNLIDENLALYATAARAKDVRLVNTLVEQITLNTDKNMLNFIIRNFLSNAVKFTPSRGEVSLRITTQGDLIKISVSDTGIGMKEEDINKLFLPGQRHTTLGTQREKGTGLGLLLCKEFAEKMGAQIEVESVLGKGSSFSLGLNRSCIEQTSFNNNAYNKELILSH